VAGYIVLFLIAWAGSAIVLSRLPWFRHRRRLSDRLAPYKARSWVDDIEAWLDGL
jgi:hypothetical protein